MSSMKTLGQSNIFYSNDYDGWNVPQIDYGEPEKVPRWDSNLAFLNYGKFNASSTDSRVLISKACPEALAAIQASDRNAEIWTDPARTYMKHIWAALEIDSNYSPPDQIRAFKTGRLKQPSLIAQFMDGNVNRWAAQTYTHLDLIRHGGNVLNVIFYDAHVSQETITELTVQASLRQRIWGANGKTLGQVLKNGGN